MIRNRIPKFFLFRKLFRTEFLGFFSLPKMVWNRIPRFFSSKNGSERNSVGFLFQEMDRNKIPRVFLFQEKVQNGFPKVFSSKKWLGTEFRGFFSSQKWFGTKFRCFSLPRNRRNSNGNATCTVLFSIPRNNFLSESGNLKKRGVLTPSLNTLGNLDHL